MKSKSFTATIQGTLRGGYDLPYALETIKILLGYNGSELVDFDLNTIKIATLQQPEPEPEPLTYLPMEETRARLIHNALASYQASLMQQGDMETANQRNKCQQLMDTIRDTIIGPLEKLGRIAK